MKKIRITTALTVSVTFLTYLVSVSEVFRFTKAINASYYWIMVALGIGCIFFISKERQKKGYRFEFDSLLLSVTVGLLIPMLVPSMLLFLNLNFHYVKNQDLGNIISVILFIGIASLGFIGNKDHEVIERQYSAN